MQPLELSILLHRALEARLERILQLTAEDGWLEDVDAVHDVRVASRRLRTVLGFIDPERYPGLRSLRKRAKALTRALGATRELDVHMQKLAALGPELIDQTGHAVLEHVLETFDRRRSKARRRMVRGVGRVKIQELLRLRVVEDPPAGEVEAAEAARALLQPMLDRALSGLAERVAAEDAARLHPLRIDLKKLRYAVEVLAEALPGAATEWLARFKTFQGALGEHHDWTVLEGDLWELHAFLTSNRRAALAAGTLDLLGIAIEHRSRAFADIQAAAGAIDPRAATAALTPGGRPA